MRVSNHLLGKGCGKIVYLEETILALDQGLERLTGARKTHGY